MSTFSAPLALGDPDCKDIPYPQLKAPVPVDWVTESVATDLAGNETKTSVTRKDQQLHECHSCGGQWICPHPECGDKAHGCTRGVA